ncbi:MAG: hypothetical protein WBQ23_01270 [Bacteroidota bacterium]
MPFRSFLFLFLVFGMTACNSDRSQDIPGSRLSRAEAPEQANAVQAPPPGPAYERDPELKSKLKAELESIRKANLQGSRSSEIQTLITELSSLCRSLSVTARALGRSGAFSGDINSEIAKFNSANLAKKDDAGKIMNGMSGVYGMYALLAKMKFVGQQDKQSEIQAIHDETIKALRPEAAAVEAAAAIADACYALSTMIIRDIDTEERYVKAFEQIDRQYQQGTKVAKNQEDLFINGMFRTFEVSQLWLLSINGKASEKITELNDGVSSDSAEATNVGMQMSIAVKYLFLISYLIAQDTVNLTL